MPSWEREVEVIDETLEQRWGSKISKRGHYRDSALSSHKQSVSSPGLRWIVMAIVVTLPFVKVEDWMTKATET
jgi:hypothetical protein